MIWLSPQGLPPINRPDELERQSRQWGMASSLLLVSAVVLLLTTKLNSLLVLAGRNPADNVVNLEYRVVQPQPEVMLEPVPPPVEQLEPEQKPVIDEVVEQPVEEVTPEPEPPPVMRQVVEKQEPVIPKKIKPVSRKKKVVQQKKEPVKPPVKKQAKPQAVVQPPPVEIPSKPVQKAEIAPEPAAYEQSMVDTAPAAVSKKKPSYPYRARRMNITGLVEVRFLVNKKGLVEELEIIRAKPEGIFAKAVRKEITSWRFQPGVKNGRAVATWMTTTINFELE